MANIFDVAVVGAGAAGMMCAAVAGARGKTVVLIDHATRLAEKIRISGGGRCNFTNLLASPANYLSQNPHFCKSALSRYTPQDFLILLKRYQIAYHEKHKGQLFCDRSAQDIIAMLQAECAVAQVEWRMPCRVSSVSRQDALFRLETPAGPILATSLVVASGGLSIPKIGATDFAYRLATQFGVNVVSPRAGLVPLTFDPISWEPFQELAGVALPVVVEAGFGTKQHGSFSEDMLFTHRGLSGPAILQISSYWQPGSELQVNLLPEFDLGSALRTSKSSSRKTIDKILAQWLPTRVVDTWLQFNKIDSGTRVADMPDRQLDQLAQSLNHWRIKPSGTEGYRKAEVTLGGIDTRELSQQSMMVGKVPSLHFIGEAVDVTGWLGGYNFQWAWASGVAAGSAV
ncbi:MAG: NAD(P)/FAD-dependent oxidoreductase [Herbaspirillum sp.]